MTVDDMKTGMRGVIAAVAENEKMMATTIELGAYFTLAGLVRFAIECIRVNDPVIGVLTVAHIASLAAIAIGTALLFRSSGVHKSMASPA